VGRDITTQLEHTARQMGYDHDATIILGCQIDKNLINLSKLNANLKANDNLEADDDEGSVGSVDGEILEEVQNYIEKNFKNLSLEFGSVDDSDYEVCLSFKLGHSIKDVKKRIKYATSPEGVKEFKEAMIALGQKEHYKITLSTLLTCG
jgi:hypothetical protein